MIRNPEPTPEIRDKAFILALAKVLATTRRKPTLNRIDGEFYWRCCRTDFVRRVDEFNAILDARADEDRGVVILNTHMAKELEFRFGIPEEYCFQHLLSNHAITMRPTVIRSLAAEDDPGVATKLLLKIGSVHIKGPFLANEIYRWFREMNRDNMEAFGRSAIPEVRAEERGTHIDFRVRGPGQLQVDIGLPLPSKKLIAHAFDDSVTRDSEWKRHLPDAASMRDRQGPDVAIRTWVVGLLAAKGELWNDAMSDFTGATGLPGTQYPGFSRERSALLRRVPEAESFVFTPQ
jgi:hypothetical protein